MSSANWGGSNPVVQYLSYDPAQQSISLVPYGNTIYLDLSSANVVGPNFNIDLSGFGTQISFQADEIFETKTTGDIAKCNQPIFRFFSYTIPNPGGVNDGGGTFTIVDPIGQTYPMDKWLCVITGFSNSLGNRAFQISTGSNGSGNWAFNYTYNNDAPFGYVFVATVQILAISSCISASYSV